jgi:hypothetical protein
MESIGPLDHHRHVKDSQVSSVNLGRDLHLDVVIPVAEKDLEVLPVALEGIRENVRHPIDRIIVVSRGSTEAEELFRFLGCEFCHETDCVPVPRSDIEYVLDGIARSGWLFQQFVKWGGLPTVNDNYWVIDADTLLIGQHVFEEDGKTMFFHSQERHLPYYDAYQRIVGEEIVSPLSFVAHLMLMNRERVSELKAHIEKTRSRAWYNAMIANIDLSEMSVFSAYETYGNWMLSRHPGQIIRYHCSNLSFPREEPGSHAELKSKHSSLCRSISFHCYVGRT